MNLTHLKLNRIECYHSHFVHAEPKPLRISLELAFPFQDQERRFEFSAEEFHYEWPMPTAEEWKASVPPQPIITAGPIKPGGWPGLSPNTAEEFRYVGEIYAELAAFMQAYPTFTELFNLSQYMDKVLNKA